MNVSISNFGRWQGRDVYLYTLKNNNGLEVSCTNYGCIITQINVPDCHGIIENVVLGFNRLEDYITNRSIYFGGTIGRVAGRIKNANFQLNNQYYYLPKNNNGKHHIHGGEHSFSNVLWNAKPIETESEIGIEFTYLSKDGEEGYPGNVQMTVTYSINDQNQLFIRYHAISDEDTLLNVTNHSYFNLSGNLKTDILNHYLTLKSSDYLKMNENLFPTGEIVAVENSPFDFRKPKKIKTHLNVHNEELKRLGGYDHIFLLDKNDEREIVLHDKVSGRRLVVETDEPAVVVYSANFLDNHVILANRIPARKHLGICLEPERIPIRDDNHGYPSLLLKKENPYISQTVYSFEVE